MYRFENANTTKEYYMPSSNICSIYEFDENFEKNCVMVLGQLKYLFGKPRYITNNLENQFSYIIKAINEETKEYLFLEVYAASSDVLNILSLIFNSYALIFSTKIIAF